MGRNPDRIPEVLDAVEEYWQEHPDLRLGQLMWKIAGTDPFHMEDSELMGLIDESMEVDEFVGEGGIIEDIPDDAKQFEFDNE